MSTVEPPREDRPEWRETDEWIVPSGLTSTNRPRPATETRREPEPVQPPALTRDGFTEALRALGRDGGERA